MAGKSDKSQKSSKHSYKSEKSDKSCKSEKSNKSDKKGKKAKKGKKSSKASCDDGPDVDPIVYVCEAEGLNEWADRIVIGLNGEEVTASIVDARQCEDVSETDFPINIDITEPSTGYPFTCERDGITVGARVTDDEALLEWYPTTVTYSACFLNNS